MVLTKAEVLEDPFETLFANVKLSKEEALDLIDANIGGRWAESDPFIRLPGQEDPEKLHYGQVHDNIHLKPE